MIILDTHIWVWWVHNDPRLTHDQIKAIKDHEDDLIGISAISLWEIAKLVERKRLIFPFATDKWFEQAINYPGIGIIELTPEIAYVSTQLPGEFHRDPADQIIVATAKVYKCILVTSDEKIIQYPHIKTIP